MQVGSMVQWCRSIRCKSNKSIMGNFYTEEFIEKPDRKKRGQLFR